MYENKQTWNVKNLLKWATDYFTSKGIPQPRLSAELLLSDALDYTRMQLYLNFERIPQEKDRKKFREYILRRIEHEPVQYILNKSCFRNLELFVDKNVLIPRPETELLVDRALYAAFDVLRKKALLKKIEDSVQGEQTLDLNILEIGTGSGAIALSLATEMDGFIRKQDELQKLSVKAGTIPVTVFRIKWQIFATENSEGAFKVATKNAAKILPADCIENLKFIKSDIIPDDGNFYAENKETIDIIISNPPYITDSGYNDLPREVREYEPVEALLAGKYGTEFYEKIIKTTRGLLAKNPGYYIFETDPVICNSLVKSIEEYLKPAFIEVEKDYNNLERLVTVRI